MNKWQKTVIVAAAVLVLAMCLYAPSQFKFAVDPAYRWLWAFDTWERIDLARLMVQISVVLLAAATAMWLLKTPKSTE